MDPPELFIHLGGVLYRESPERPIPYIAMMKPIQMSPCNDKMLSSCVKSKTNKIKSGRCTPYRDAVARHGPVDRQIYGTARPGISWHGKSWHGTTRKIWAQKNIGPAWHEK